MSIGIEEFVIVAKFIYNFNKIMFTGMYNGLSISGIGNTVNGTFLLNVTFISPPAEPDVWGSAAIFVGVISSFSISQVAGEGNKWSCQMNLKIGQQVT